MRSNCWLTKDRICATTSILRPVYRTVRWSKSIEADLWMPASQIHARSSRRRSHGGNRVWAMRVARMHSASTCASGKNSCLYATNNTLFSYLCRIIKRSLYLLVPDLRRWTEPSRISVERGSCEVASGVDCDWRYWRGRLGLTCEVPSLDTITTRGLFWNSNSP